MSKDDEQAPDERRASPDVHGMHEVDRALLGHAIDWLERTRAPRAAPVSEARLEALPASLPERGIGPMAALDALAPTALQGTAQLHHPGYFAHMDPPTPAVTWAAGLWQHASNQNLLHPDVAPSARGLSERMVEWLAPFFGMAGGHFVPGATVANLTALWAARELRGIRRVLASNRAHLSIRKSADILGLEFQALDSDPAHRMLEQDLGELGDTAVVRTAGTVAAGAIDPLDLESAAAWVHVDAAWAGPLRLSDSHAARLRGIERADSVGISAHKWLYQPKGAALVLFREARQAHQALSYGGGYLAAPNIGLLGSTPANALPLAATLLSLGRAGIASLLDKDMANAKRLVERIAADSRFACLGPMQSGVVVWRPLGADPETVRRRLRNAWVSVLEIDGERWFRSVAANPGADPDYFFERVVEAL